MSPGSRRSASHDDSYDLLNQYLQEISKIARLTPERERELGYLVQQGDRAALEELVQANLRFVVSYAKRFRNAHVLFLDLINEGNIGLIHAAKKFDPDKNVKFITYAVWWIRQAILHALSEQGGPFRLPPKRANLMYRLERMIAQIVTEENRFPPPEELAEKLAVTVREINTLMQAMNDSFSLSSELDGESHTELGDLIEQTTVPSAEDELTEQAARGELLERMAALSSKERLILCLRHGVSDNLPRGAADIAEFMGLEPPRIAASLAAAKAKMCATLEITEGELAHLLLNLNPNPRASLTWWVRLGGDENGKHYADPTEDRFSRLENLKHTGAAQTAMESALALEERVVLKLHYGILQDELTLRDIGDLLGLSRERVRQIEARAEAKCRRLVRRDRTR
jgi:RNA polymerase primary sigma factor